MAANEKKLRLENAPGVVRWLMDLEYFGPSKRPSGRSGVSARNHKLTDFWVQHADSKQWMFLQTLEEKERGTPRWWEKAENAEGYENITPKGRRILREFLETREGQTIAANWKTRRRKKLALLAKQKPQSEEVA